eukprot:209058-Pelagomonas_calceolata.AAC.1
MCAHALAQALLRLVAWLTSSFTQVRIKEQHVMRDDDEPGTQALVRERHIHVTGFHCNADSLSFYDESGSIQGVCWMPNKPDLHQFPQSKG